MQQTTAIPPYLTGVQGLRTIAALLVAIYHIWFDRVSGGVDVFFVVAGYFAVRSLTKLGATQGWRQRGQLVLRYWARTARRVIPLSAVVVLATVGAALLWMPRSLWDLNIPHGWASLFFVENWYLVAANADYLQQGLGTSPFQQFWALSLQVQFYAAVPVIVLAAVALAHWRNWTLRATTIGTMSVIFIGSLAFSVFLTHADQPVAYFHLFTRMWEFLVGGLLALLLTRSVLRRWVAQVLGWGGLILLVTLGAVVDVSAMFPGYLAFLPVVAAVAIIVSAANGYSPFPLRATVVVKFAESSFAFYLWHWPILVFYRYHFDDEVNLVHGMLIIGLAMVLALVTTYFVEKPIREWWRLQQSGLATAVVCTLLAGAAATSLVLWKNESDRVGQTVLTPSPAEAREDIVDAYARGCHQDQNNPEVKQCLWGDEAASRTIAVVGGSHSAQWIDAVREVAGSHDAKVVSMTKSGCLFGDVSEMRERPSLNLGGVDENDFDASCEVWAESVKDEITASRPDVVVTIATRNFGDQDEFPQGYLRYFEDLSDHGVSVVGIRDNPWFGFDPPTCVEGGNALECGISRESFYAEDIDVNVPELPGFTFVDIADDLCSEESCQVVQNDILIYRDFNHLTKTWTMKHGESLRAAIGSSLSAHP